MDYIGDRILILLTFQFMFLPYHSHLATWTHRLLILLELVVGFKLWPLVLNPQRDFQWSNWQWQGRRIAARAKGLFGSNGGRRRARQGLRQLALPTAAAALFILLSLSLATFPGERHVNLVTGEAIDGVQCRRWIQQKFGFADMRFDRLALARVDVVDHDKLEKIEQATSKAGDPPYQGERTRILRDRNLNCGDFSDYADLRRIDLSDARLKNADFKYSKLEGISFARSQLQGAVLDSAELQGASLDQAQLQGASLAHAKLQGASLDGAQLQGAYLFDAQLQGAHLLETELQGAYLYVAQFQAASLFGTRLQGASLDGAMLQGALLKETKLQGASLYGAQLQGAELLSPSIDSAILSRVWIWRVAPRCNGARVTEPKSDAAIAREDFHREAMPATPEKIKEFITWSVAGIQDGTVKERVSNILRERLTADPTNDDTAGLGEAWRRCESESAKIAEEEFDRRHIAVLRGAVCDAKSDGAAIGAGVTRNWISEKKVEFRPKLARALLGEDGKPCASTKYYDEGTKAALRGAAGPPPAPIAPK